METFNSKLKKEICSNLPQDQRQAIIRLSAIIKTCGEITKTQNGFQVVDKTELLELFDLINNIIENVFHDSASLLVSEDVGYNDKPKYEITLPEKLTKQILLDCEIAFYDEEKSFCIYPGISQYLLESEEDCAEYLKGVFLATGTSNITLSSSSTRENKSSGYQLEFVFYNKQLSHDFGEMLANLGIITKTILRNENFVLYVQSFDEVCSLIGIMGATKSFLDLQNENITREMRSKLNRQNNCYSGNITKQVNASFHQLEIIEHIQNTIGIESLEKPLQEVCFLRLANPEESLDNLVKLSQTKITKSGIYHRFQKLEKIAKEL